MTSNEEWRTQQHRFKPVRFADDRMNLCTLTPHSFGHAGGWRRKISGRMLSILSIRWTFLSTLYHVEHDSNTGETEAESECEEY